MNSIIYMKTNLIVITFAHKENFWNRMSAIKKKMGNKWRKHFDKHGWKIENVFFGPRIGKNVPEIKFSTKQNKIEYQHNGFTPVSRLCDLVKYEKIDIVVTVWKPLFGLFSALAVAIENAMYAHILVQPNTFDLHSCYILHYNLILCSISWFLLMVTKDCNL